MAPQMGAKTVELPIDTRGNRMYTTFQVRGTHLEGGGSVRVKRCKEFGFGVQDVSFSAAVEV